MDKKRLQELGGVVAETTEQEKALEVAAAAEPKVLEEEVGLEEGGFGFRADKSPEQDTMSSLAHMLHEAKAFLRDGNMEDAAMMIDIVSC